MDCPNCKIPMDKDQVNMHSKDEVALATSWLCRMCGYSKHSQHNIAKDQFSQGEKNEN